MCKYIRLNVLMIAVAASFQQASVMLTDISSLSTIHQQYHLDKSFPYARKDLIHF